MTPPSAPRKKLIEVALPLEEINAACKADKGRAHGTLKNFHKWFAPMPVPAWRALLFAALVDDPVDDNRRVYLLDLIKRLVANGADPPYADTVDEARAVLRRQFPAGVPTVLDPFCGGGSTLVEAQRLGLPTEGSDLNPVPVLITRALTDLLPKVHGRQPRHPEPIDSSGHVRAGQGSLMSASSKVKTYTGYDGLIRDVTFYADRIRDQAWAKLQRHYPSQPGETSIAWLWARTATCPNPACGVQTILTTSWWLSKKKNDLAWIQPEFHGDQLSFRVVTGQRTGSAPESPKVGRGANFKCLRCTQVLTEQYLSSPDAGPLGYAMTAVIVETGGFRTYRSPTSHDVMAARSLSVDVGSFADIPVTDGGSRNRFGLETHADLYIPRQMVTLATFADLVSDTHAQLLAAGAEKDWADVVTAWLALMLSRQSMFSSTQARWTVRDNVSSFEAAFPRNDLPMTWDFYEINVFQDAGPSWSAALKSIGRSLVNVVPGGVGVARREDARHAHLTEGVGFVATDPPYFDAIGYADLSDYFYIWHRRALRHVFPDLYGTIAAPKAGELTAIPSHHGNSMDEARNYFIRGFTETFKNLEDSMAPTLPMLVIYASKEQKSGRGEETRWESILTAMVDADLEITGTWPITGTTDRRMVGRDANALAAYVAMVCRQRPTSARVVSKNEFTRLLRREMPAAIRDLQAGSILPVDMYQAALGPGMQIYSRYRRVEDSRGQRVPVGEALALISHAVGEVLDEQETELDAASRFAVTWWDLHGWAEGPFGQADQVARQFGTTVDDVAQAEVVRRAGGKVRLLGSGQLDRSWSPGADAKPTAWEAVHHLVDRLLEGDGETEAAALLAKLGALADPARALTYRLYDIAARRSRTKDQEYYNALIGAWTTLVALAASHTTEGLF